MSENNQRAKRERVAFNDYDIEQWAIAAGIIKDGEPLSDQILAFVDIIAEQCASIGDRYEVDDESAGEEIRAMFGLG